MASLRRTGFSVWGAGNGLEALEAWKVWDRDFVWMDILMPVMDGHEATRRTKELDQEHRTTMVGLTATYNQSQVPHAATAGWEGFLLNPFCESDVFKVMGKRLGVQYKFGKKSHFRKQSPP